MATRSYRQPNDTVTIDNSVLRTLVKAAALGVEGVARLGFASKRIDRMLGREPSEEGLHLTIENNTLTVDVFIVVDARQQLHQTCRKVQQEINRTMQQYVGMGVQAINVHVEDVTFTND